MKAAVVPVLDLWGVSNAQVDDIRRFFRKRRIPYHITSWDLGKRYLCVREKDYERAHQAVKEELSSYAIAAREKWERQWKEIYEGSYWKWLVDQNAVRVKLAALRLLLLA